MNIRQIRAQYPQYSDLSDKQLADALHAKFYSDLPIQDYYSRIGFAPERTWGETATDIGAALVSGAGGLAQFPGQVVGLLPGMRGLGETLAAPGEALKTYGEGLKSQGLKAREALRSKALSEAEKNGVLAEFATAIKETIKDPALLSTFLAEQVPMLIGPGGAAKVTTMLGKGTVEAATAGAAREAAAKALGAKATAAAVGTGAVMQGADIGEETYKEAFKIAKAQDMSDEDAQQVALAKARVAALEAGALSVAAQRLPGGKAIERRLAGLPGEGRIRGALGEALSEAIEEGGGAFAKNVGLQELDPTRSLTTGIGTAAGLGALGGAGLGAVLGGHRAEAPPPGAPAEAPIERAARKAQAAAPAAAPAPAGIPPLPDTYAELVLYGEQLKQLPKSKERDAALKAAREKREAIIAEEVKQNRLTAEKAKEFMTAEEAAAAEIQRRDGLETEAPAETPPPAETIPEPEVVKKGTVPEVLDSATIRKIGFTKGKVHDALIGKSITDPEVRAVLEQYKQDKGVMLNPKTEQRIDAFLAKLPAPTAAETPAPTETPSVPTAAPVEQPSGASPAVAGEPVAGAAPGGAGITEPTGVVPTVADVTEPAGREGQQPAAVTPDYTKFNYEQLKEMLDKADETNLSLDLAAISKHIGEEAAAAYQAMSPRQRNRWWNANATAEMEEDGSPFKGVSEETIRDFMNAQSAFDTESPELLGRSVALIVRNINEPGFTTSPEFVTLRNALAYAKEQGWSEKDVLNGMRSRAAEWAGDNAQELFRDLFKAKVERPAPPPAAPALTGRQAALPAPTKTTEVSAPAPKQKVLKGSVANRVKALGVNAAQGGVPNPKIIRETLEPIDPKMARAVMFYLGVDYDGNFLVGVNNLPQTPSAQKAGEMAGLGKNSGDRVKKVADALGVTGDIRRKYQAAQTGRIVTGTASESSQSRVSQEANTSKLIKNQLWYQPIARKGISGANDTELVRAIDKANRLLNNPANGPVYAELAAEFEKRAKRPEFVAAAKRQLGIGTETVTAEEGTPGTEEAVDEDIAELPQRPTPGVASPGITRAVNRGDTRRALQAIRETPEATPLDHQIAQRLLGLGQFLGFPKIETRPKDQIKGSGQYNASSDTASIAAGEEDTHTVLHEVTHAFVHKLIVANEKGLRNDAGYRDLKQLYDYLKKTYPALEKEYGMSSVTEFASEAMSNPQFQKKLGTIRYKTRAAWSQFVQAIRKLLKIGAGDSSALVEAIAGVDSLLRVGREYQKTGPDIGAGTVSVITPEAEATAEELDVIGEKKPDRFRDKVGRELRGNVALRLREKFVSSMAPMEDWFTKAYGGQIRTASGRLNPIVQLSRALDSGRVSKAAQVEGGLTRKDGLIVASELKNAKGESVSYLKVLKRIADTAKAEGKTYENYRNTIDNILYGHREYGLREKNNQIEQQAQALEAAGKKDEAKALRENKVKLLLNDGQIDRAEAAFQRDKFIKGVLADLDTIRFNMLDMLVDTGRITAEQAQDYKDAIGYIPFNRIGEYEEAWTNATRGANRGAAALKRMRAFEGSDRKSTSVIENFSGLMDWGTREAMKNEAARRALEDMELMGAAQRRDNKPASDSPGAIVTVYRDGTPTKYYVPDPAHIATFSMADPQLSNFWKGLSRATRVLRAGVTSMPPFAIKQVFDDIVRAYTYAGVKNNGELVRNVLTNFPKHWVNEVFKRKTDSVRELERLGIVGTFDFTQHTNLKDILRESGAEKEGLGHSILRVMEAGAKASDLAVREAIYKQVLKETGDTAKAESAAREIINFSRRGSSNAMNIAISIIPFFNAYAQGMDKLATAAAGKVVGQTTGTARSMFYKRMGVLTAMGLAYALMMQDDEDYQALPDHVRDTNWIIPGAKINGQLVGIPVPAELAFFFKAIPERVLRYYKYQGTEEEQAAIEVLGNLVTRGRDVFSSPNLMAQAVRPLYENLTNYSFFLGRPLESQAQLRLRPAERYGTGTSEAMKTVAQYLEDAANATGVEAFAISPIKLENALRGIFGTSAGIALSLADMVVNPDRTDRPLHQQLSSQLTGASAVLKSAVGTRYMDEIYNLEERTTQVYNSYNRLLETAPEKADKFLEDNIGMYSIRDAVQGVMESIRSLNDTAKLIDRDTSMSPEERRKAIDELRAEQNDIARQVYMLRKQAMNIQLGL